MDLRTFSDIPTNAFILNCIWLRQPCPTVPCGAAVHAAPIALILAEWSSPAIITVAVLNVVTDLQHEHMNQRKTQRDRGKLDEDERSVGNRCPTPWPWHLSSMSQSYLSSDTPLHS